MKAVAFRCFGRCNGKGGGWAAWGHVSHSCLHKLVWVVCALHKWSRKATQSFSLLVWEVSRAECEYMCGQLTWQHAIARMQRPAFTFLIFSVFLCLSVFELKIQLQDQSDLDSAFIASVSRLFSGRSFQREIWFKLILLISVSVWFLKLCIVFSLVLKKEAYILKWSTFLAWSRSTCSPK